MRFPARSVLSAALVLAGGALATPAPAATASVPRQTYVVTTTAGSPADELVGALGGTVRFRYAHALQGFSVSLPVASLPALRALPGVRDVEASQVLRATGTQAGPPSYGLDRIDQRNQPLDGRYRWGADGRGVTAYVLDSGIAYAHRDFGGRARGGFDAVTPGGSAEDCYGHGTHVAGTIGGTTYGVAKAVSLLSVRVLGCDGSGELDQAVAGIDWMVGHYVAGAPAVANMSVSMTGTNGALDAAVNRAISDGIVFVVSAGNTGGVLTDLLGFNDACDRSPSRVPAALTVAATDADDSRAPYSSIGPCVDLWAPGTEIISADHRSTTGGVAMSGTSMAAPHVAGTAAVYLSRYRSASPGQVSQAIVGAATPGAVTSAGSGSPTGLLLQAW